MREVNPSETTRAYAFEMWMQAPVPMVTFFKTLDVTRLVRVGKMRGLKFNMLMCWCVGKAASDIKEFYLLPVGNKLIQYDSIAVNTIVANRQGEVSSCDIPFTLDKRLFNDDYLRLTRQVADSCENHDLTDSMVIGTSALARYEIDGAVGMYSGLFNNPWFGGGCCGGGFPMMGGFMTGPTYMSSGIVGGMYNGVPLPSMRVTPYFGSGMSVFQNNGFFA